MASVGCPQVSVRIRQPGRARLRGSLHFSGIRASQIWFGLANWVGSKRGATLLVVSEPRFRHLCKNALNEFVKGF